MPLLPVECDHGHTEDATDRSRHHASEWSLRVLRLRTASLRGTNRPPAAADSEKVRAACGATGAASG